MAESFTIVDDENIKQVVQFQQTRMQSLDTQLEQFSTDLSKMGERITKHRDDLTGEIRDVADAQIEMKALLAQISRQLNGRRNGPRNGKLTRRDSAMLGSGAGAVGLLEVLRIVLGG